MQRRYVLQRYRYDVHRDAWYWVTMTEFGTTALMEEQVDILNRLLRENDYKLILKEEER